MYVLEKTGKLTGKITGKVTVKVRNYSVWYKGDRCVCAVGENNGTECGEDTLHNDQRWVKLLHNMKLVS